MNPITFSTLACPDWHIQTIIAKAAEYGYDGIEWRGGLQGHVRPDMPAAEKSLLRKGCSDAGLLLLAVTTYTSFVADSAGERQENVDELQRYSDLAAELGATYVRAFLGELPAGTALNSQIYENISSCLSLASAYAVTVGVKIAVEPHDNFARSPTVAALFDRYPSHPDLRVIWDPGNAFAAGEGPAEGFGYLKDKLAYVQIKDGKINGASWQLCPLGKGDVPLGQAFELLSGHGYEGAVSVEWEYAWHPELDPPEIALPAALKTARNLFTAARSEAV